MILFLTGFMGSGKSTVGRGVARLLKVPFIDLDSAIENEEGISVPEIFSRKGELYFRESESRVLRSLPSRYDSAVVATGGGTPCYGGNIDFMLNTGIVVYLSMPPAAIVSRLRGGERSSRPLIASLDDDELLPYVSGKLKEREPFYRRATLVAGALNATPEKITGLLRDNGYL